MIYQGPTITEDDLTVSRTVTHKTKSGAQVNIQLKKLGHLDFGGRQLILVANVTNNNGSLIEKFSVIYGSSSMSCSIQKGIDNHQEIARQMGEYSEDDLLKVIAQHL